MEANRFRLLSFVAIIIIACGGTPAAWLNTPPPPTGTPALGITILPRMEPTPTQRDYVEAVDLAYNAGVRATVQTWRWSQLEPSASNFDLGRARGDINYATQRGFVLLVGIQAVNTTAKETPPDLKNVPFDSPQMKNRFRALIDALKPLLNQRVLYLSIGNEADVYLGLHPNEWDAYQSFYEDALAYVHSVAPWIKVGVTSTFDNAKRQVLQVQKLNTQSDVFIMTYYPLEERFVPRSPGVPRSEIPKMIEMAQGRPLIFQEVGYPTSAILLSSEEKQAEFVADVFTTWSANRSSIPFLAFFALHDLPADICDDMTTYYGITGEVNFVEFLCSLGLRQVNGTPKRGWEAFVDGASSIE